MSFYLGFDVGTSESKGVLIDQEGNVIATASKKHDIISPRKNFKEHDPENTWYGDFKSIVAEILQKSRVPSSDIECIGISTIMAGVTPVDKNGKALRNSILYGIDTRCIEQANYINHKIGEDELRKLCGRICTVESFGAKILWIRENEPDIFKKTKKFTFDAGYLVSKLTGEYCVDQYSVSFAEPMINCNTMKWHDPTIDIICDKSQLPEIRNTIDIVGEVTYKAAKETGLTEGTKVICGTTDAGAEAVSVGVLDVGDMMLMYGSTSFFALVTDKPYLDDQFWSTPYTIPGKYVQGGGMATTGSVTKWIRNELSKDLVEKEKHGKLNAYDVLFSSIDEIPPGSDGLILLPYFSGERMPIQDPNARGLLLGLRLEHTRSHIMRAACEGVGFGINQNLSLLRDKGFQIKQIRAVGGGARNKNWLQIVSDICNVSQSVPEINLGASYGNALLAGLGCGHFTIDDLHDIIKYKQVIEPIPQNHEKYTQYQEIFDASYLLNKDHMHKLSDLS